jgi:peptidoglycan/LPS O-acetylase OafA/YrhL
VGFFGPALLGRALAAARTFGLDLLRCVAILMVLANHAFLAFFLDPGRTSWHGVQAFLSTISVVSIEWLFALSGFLIGAIMIRSFEAEPSFWPRARSFWLRRWFRTLPNYYLFVLVNVAIVALGIAGGEFSVSFLFFAQNLAWPMVLPPFFPESWTLATDEWFYFVMPILVGVFAWARTDLRRAFLLAALALTLVPAVLRWVAEPAVDGGDWDHRFRAVTIYHLDATGWGVLAAIVSRWHRSIWDALGRHGAVVGGFFTTAGLAMLEAYTFGPAWVQTFPRTFTALPITLMGAGSLALLPWVSRFAAGDATRTAAARISDYTYSIYLSHLPLALILRHWLPMDRLHTGVLLAIIVGWVALTVALSAAIFHSFEKPVSDLRERFTRKVDARPFPSTPLEPGPP